MSLVSFFLFFFSCSLRRKMTITSGTSSYIHLSARYTLSFFSSLFYDTERKKIFTLDRNRRKGTSKKRRADSK